MFLGQHYWYDISNDMDCEDFFPFFLLYNSDVLNGFGFATAANLDSKRIEHPPKDKLWVSGTAKVYGVTYIPVERLPQQTKTS